MATTEARTASLAGARAKVDRALEQFHSLQAEIGPWIESQPQDLWFGFDAETQRWSYALINGGEDAPLRFAVIIGEIVHDLRSALDHLVGQLVLAEGNDPTDRNQFPIYSDKVDRDPKQWKDRRNRWQAMLRGVNPTERATIKALQPYRRAHRILYSALAELASLSNTDKHNLLVTTVVGVAPDDLLPWLLAFDPLPFGAQYVDIMYADPPSKRIPWPIPPGRTELVSLRVEPPTVHPHVRVNRRLPMTVAFGKSLLPIDDILNLTDEVTTILDHFERVIG